MTKEGTAISTDPGQPAPGPIAPSADSGERPASDGKPDRSRRASRRPFVIAAALLLLTAGTAVGLSRPSWLPWIGLPHYRAIEDLCSVVDLGDLRTMYPAQGPAHHVTTGAEMGCHVPMHSTVGAFFGLDVTVLADPAAAKRAFEAGRVTHLAVGPLNQVRDLGAAAYWHLEPGQGTDLVVYDGNLYLHSWFGTLDPADATPPDITDRLATICRETLRKLRA